MYMNRKGLRAEWSWNHPVFVYRERRTISPSSSHHFKCQQWFFQSN